MYDKQANDIKNCVTERKPLDKPNSTAGLDTSLTTRMCFLFVFVSNRNFWTKCL